FVKQDVSFQHSVLKQSGKRSFAGNLVMLLLIGWLGFTIHTFVGQRLRTRAIESAQKPLQEAFYTQKRDVVGAQKVLDQVESAASWTLLADPMLREVRAMLRGAVNRHKDAEHELTEMYEARGELFYPE